MTQTDQTTVVEQCDREPVTQPVRTEAGEVIRDALRVAYEQGANDVHDEWLRANPSRVETERAIAIGHRLDAEEAKDDDLAAVAYFHGVAHGKDVNRALLSEALGR